MTRRTPTWIQLMGLGVTLAAVAAFSLFTLDQLSGLKRLGSDIVDRNRRDSLQLIRIQDDISQLGLALRDMAEGTEPYPLGAYRPQFERLKGDLEDALEQEARLMPSTRTAAQRQLLDGAFQRFWLEVDGVWAEAAAGREREARARIGARLEPERAIMATAISRLLVQNNDAEAAAVSQIQAIHDRVQRNLYAMLAAVVAAIVVTGGLVIWHDRRMFAQVARLSEERKELAGQVIKVQEDLFRTLARELHDEFGQVLTAIGLMVQRVEKRLAEGSEERAGLLEARQIANQTLERVRGMSQMLHPPVLDDYGLERSVEWYLRQWEKQTGIRVRYEKIGVAPWIGDRVAIHVYRILQEALNNVARHARVEEASVRVSYTVEQMEMIVEDRGPGLPESMREKGLGMIGMRERAELVGGRIAYERPTEGGARVRLTVPMVSQGGKA